MAAGGWARQGLAFAFNASLQSWKLGQQHVLSTIVLVLDKLEEEENGLSLTPSCLFLAVYFTPLLSSPLPSRPSSGGLSQEPSRHLRGRLYVEAAGRRGRCRGGVKPFPWALRRLVGDGESVLRSQRDITI